MTPVRNDAVGLRRLARVIAAQTARPCAWVIVDHRSDDATAAVAASVANDLPDLTVVDAPASVAIGRGGSVGELLEIGFEAITSAPEVVIKVDADVSFGRRHMERLLAAFAEDERLGVASGSRFERYERGWYLHTPTSFHVEAQCRAYRSSCLVDVLPFERRLGWETVDLVRAQQAGWATRCLRENVFAHHRPIGGAGSRRQAFFDEGVAAHFVGYRLDYLVLRTLFRMRRERVAASQVAGYLHACATRSARIDDPDVVSLVRREQRLRRLSARAREACAGG